MAVTADNDYAYGLVFNSTGTSARRIALTCLVATCAPEEIAKADMAKWNILAPISDAELFVAGPGRALPCIIPKSPKANKRCFGLPYDSRLGWLPTYAAADSKGVYVGVASESGGTYFFKHGGSMSRPDFNLLNQIGTMAAFDGTVYLAAEGAHDILSCRTPTCGHAPKPFCETDGKVTSIAADRSGVYWTVEKLNNNGEGALLTCPLSGCAHPTVLVPGLGEPTSVSLSENYVVWINSKGTSSERRARSPSSEGGLLAIEKPLSANRERPEYVE